MSFCENIIIKFINKFNLIKKFDCNKFIFYFLLSLKNKPNKFKININTNCLVLAQYPGAETKGLGGLIAQNPKNFEVLCLTNGSTMLSEFSAIESTNIKKQQFQDVMKFIRAKGSKIFDIDDETLKNHYQTFKKIDISDADYIFIPNIYDANEDTIALLKHFKQLLKEKDYKKNLKVVMYESDYPLCYSDFLVDITSIISTKKKMLEYYYPKDKFPSYIEKIVGLNAFRSIKNQNNYAEAFMIFDVDEFLNIPII